MSKEAYDRARYWLNFAEIKLAGLLALSVSAGLGITSLIFSSDFPISFEVLKVGALFAFASALVCMVGLFPRTKKFNGDDFLDTPSDSLDAEITFQVCELAKITQTKLTLMKLACVSFMLTLLCVLASVGAQLFE